MPSPMRAVRSRSASPSGSPSVSPTVLVLAGIVSVQFGGALAATLVPLIGAPATVTFRLLVSAVIMALITRPRLRGHGWPAWRAGLLFGVALGTMNFTFYEALARLPIGVAVTIEFLGPLALSAALSRKAKDAAAVVAALLGVVLISQALTVPWDQLDHAGIAFAATAGACWAAYILCSREVGRHFASLDGLTVALVVAAALVSPIGVLTAHGPLTSPAILLGGVGIALLSSIVPYSLELLALRRMDPRVFGILLSLEPAVAALAGLLILRQRLDLVQLLGMALVVGASVLIMTGARTAAIEAETSADVG